MKTSIVALLLCLVTSDTFAQDAPVKTLSTDVHVFDGVHEKRIENSNVLIEGNLIASVSSEPIEADGATVIDGGGRTLMPGLTDAHWHTMHAHIASMEVLVNDIGYLTLAGAEAAEATLMRGFTTVRDVGGPVFGIKKMIDEGRYLGPRIYPSGAYITQTSGHGDFRFPTVMTRKDGRELLDQEIMG